MARPSSAPLPPAVPSSDEHLDQQEPPAIAGPAHTPRSRRGSIARADRQAQPGGRVVATPGARAEPAQQPLAEDRQQAAPQHVGLDAHVQQPAQGLDGAAGMERAQQQVAGQRGLQGGLGRGAIADLADHDDLGVLPHEEPQAGGQVQAGRRIDLRLGHAGHGHLDRVFQRDEAAAAAATCADQFAQAGVDGGRLAAAGRPGNEDRAGGLAQQLPQRGAGTSARQAQVVEPLVLARAAEEPHHGPLAVERGKRAQPHFHVAAGHADAAFLRHVGADR